MDNARDSLQKIVAEVIATSPAGNQLCLIGGFRYRLLDKSPRVSQDLDYHWPGDLAEKQKDLLTLMERRAIPEVGRRLGYEGDARTGSPADESDWLRSIHLAFWKTNVAYSRIEIPLEITHIECSDKPQVKVVDGTVYLTSSDADMVESKVIALFRRQVIEHRDLCDIFLFADRFAADSASRLSRKLAAAAVARSIIAQRLDSFASARKFHADAIERIVRDQLDAPSADAILASGGGAMILDTVVERLTKQLRIGEAGAP